MYFYIAFRLNSTLIFFVCFVFNDWRLIQVLCFRNKAKLPEHKFSPSHALKLVLPYPSMSVSLNNAHGEKKEMHSAFTCEDKENQFLSPKRQNHLVQKFSKCYQLHFIFKRGKREIDMGWKQVSIDFTPVWHRVGAKISVPAFPN